MAVYYCNNYSAADVWNQINFVFNEMKAVNEIRKETVVAFASSFVCPERASARARCAFQSVDPFAPLPALSRARLLLIVLIKIVQPVREREKKIDRLHSWIGGLAVF